MYIVQCTYIPVPEKRWPLTKSFSQTHSQLHNALYSVHCTKLSYSLLWVEPGPKLRAIPATAPPKKLKKVINYLEKIPWLGKPQKKLWARTESIRRMIRSRSQSPEPTEHGPNSQHCTTTTVFDYLEAGGWIGRQALPPVTGSWWHSAGNGRRPPPSQISSLGWLKIERSII